MIRSINRSFSSCLSVWTYKWYCERCKNSIPTVPFFSQEENVRLLLFINQRTYLAKKKKEKKKRNKTNQISFVPLNAACLIILASLLSLFRNIWVPCNWKSVSMNNGWSWCGRSYGSSIMEDTQMLSRSDFSGALSLIIGPTRSSDCGRSTSSTHTVVLHSLYDVCMYVCKYVIVVSQLYLHYLPMHPLSPAQ